MTGSVVWLAVLIIILHLLGADIWIQKPRGRMVAADVGVCVSRVQLRLGVARAIAGQVRTRAGR